MRCARTVITSVALVLVAIGQGSARAETEPTPRRWRLLADSMLLARGNQGGQIDIGYRLGLVAGVLTPSIDLYVSLDRQMGGRQRVVDAGGGMAGWRDWVASVRAGRRIEVVKGLWIASAGGVALVHSSMTSGMMRGEQSTLGLDITSALVWRSRRVTASVVFGATLVPFDDEIAVDGMRFELPARVEPWGGLGVGILF